MQREPTREEQERIEKQGLNWKEWLVLASSTSENLHIISKTTGKERHLPWRKERK
jgi:hypothetical protein